MDGRELNEKRNELLSLISDLKEKGLSVDSNHEIYQLLLQLQPLFYMLSCYINSERIYLAFALQQNRNRDIKETADHIVQAMVYLFHDFEKFNEAWERKFAIKNPQKFRTELLIILNRIQVRLKTEQDEVFPYIHSYYLHFDGMIAGVKELITIYLLLLTLFNGFNNSFI